MDSVTQAVLGAAVGTAVMGRSRPVWQAALAGALIGTLPDLDVFIDKGDPIRDMVLHRAETHALFWQALASPWLALSLAGLTHSGALFRRWWLMVVLTLFSHSALDAMTVYGTRILLPFSDYPVGLGSLFIIDPLYTLPLVLGLVVTLVVRSSGRYRWNAAGLVLSSLYAGWALLAQLHVTEVATGVARASGLPTAPVLVTPTPFNTLLWRVVLIDRDHYWEGFHSLFDPARDSGPQIRFERFERGAALDRRTLGFVDADLVRAFSKGFYALADDGRFIHITDLRMGQSPYFPFSFAFAEHHSEPLRAIEPIELRRRIPFEDGIHWLTRRLQGIDTPSPRG